MSGADTFTRSLGARPLPAGRCRFSVWAPKATQVEVVIERQGGRPVPLSPAPGGYFCGTADGVPPGSEYRYRIDGGPPLPDPASRLQPRGVDGPSAVVSPDFPWTDGGYTGVTDEQLVLYEVHVGTFTPKGTFDAAAEDLKRLVDLGVTAIEIMPVSAFPGARNWGYDGVFPFAVQESYGGPEGLCRFVDACHRHGLAVLMDMVYNHLGPEGNVLSRYGPYFTDRYRTPWGDALNFDGPESDHVRRYFLEQGLAFLADYHLDGFRLDAVGAIIDTTPRTFLEEFTDTMHRFGRRSGRSVHVIAEDDRNDPRLVRPASRGGVGFDAVWNDDFHHSVHAALTGERQAYYQDFGPLEAVANVLAGAYAYPGRHSFFRGRRHGRRIDGEDGRRFVAFMQNHDQVGNRSQGERLGALLSFEAVKLSAALTVLSPFRPMLFMGEEYGEKAPFLYFTSHQGEALAEAVRAGRKAEFSGMFSGKEPPDPQAEQTFMRSKLAWPRPQAGCAGALTALYHRLLAIRKSHPAIFRGLLARTERRSGSLLRADRTLGAETLVLFVNFDHACRLWRSAPGGQVLVDTAEDTWLGPVRPARESPPGDRLLEPLSAVCLLHQEEGPSGPQREGTVSA